MDNKTKENETENERIRYLRRWSDDYDILQGIAKTLHKIDEGDCNGRSERGQKISETRATNLMKDAQEIADRYGFMAYHQGDPRGCPLYIITKEQKASGQYHDGIAVGF